jgi:hypothetical protein
MFLHPDLALAQFHARERELIAEADRHRLLSAARRRRGGHREARVRARPAARGRPEATLAPCEPSVAA